MISLAVMSQGLQRFGILNVLSRLSLCESRRGPRSDPVRAKWFKEGEKPTHYFFRPKNQRAAKNSFESLTNSQGQEVSSQIDIKAILVDYKNLYSKDNLDLRV